MIDVDFLKVAEFWVQKIVDVSSPSRRNWGPKCGRVIDPESAEAQVLEVEALVMAELAELEDPVVTEAKVLVVTLLEVGFKNTEYIIVAGSGFDRI